MSAIERDGATVAIIGGGMAGLAAATYLARAGMSVRLYEKAHDVGGRARTHRYGDFRFNQGPHALYAGGAGMAVLKELGVAIRGSKPPLSGWGIRQGRLAPLPFAPLPLLQSDLLDWRDKVELTRFLVGLPNIDAHRFARVSLADWVATHIQREGVRHLLFALARLFTYANAPESLSAEAFLLQFVTALRGVYYLDGGWQSLVDQLRDMAQLAGAEIFTSQRIIAMQSLAGGYGLVAADHSVHTAMHVVIATDPTIASMLVAGAAPGVNCAWGQQAHPIHAACLDLGMRRLTYPDRAFAVGIDQPLYFSVHSNKALELAPTGQVMLHAAMYLQPDATRAQLAAAEGELEAGLDLLQPGWRDEVIERRYLPRMVVNAGIPTAAQGGMGGRPASAISGMPGVFLAGDWVGPEGLLVDASLASARSAARLIIQQGHEQYSRKREAVEVP